MNHLLDRGVDEVIEKTHLEERLKRGDKLRVKLGIDPTAKDLHLGHTVVLRKFRQFQNEGHQGVFIIGDFTASIGDPSGRSELRPFLTRQQIEDNMDNYLREASKVIDIDKAEIHYNSEWFNKAEPSLLFDLTSKFTVARMLERDDFQKRIKEDRDISVLEILYPILQGYDSFAVKADVELGGTDQKFNLLTGRKVQKRYNQPEQDIITVPIIEGIDGVKKMSKSLNNYIGLSEYPKDMYGKIMSLPDELMVKYFTLLTDVNDAKIEELRKDRANSSLAKKTPKEWKEDLAFEIVKTYWGKDEAIRSQNEFRRVFFRGNLPEDVPIFALKGNKSVVDVLVNAGLTESKAEAKRLIDQKAVRVNSEIVQDWGYQIKSGDIIKVGPRKFLKII